MTFILQQPKVQDNVKRYADVSCCNNTLLSMAYTTLSLNSFVNLLRSPLDIILVPFFVI